MTSDPIKVLASLDISTFPLPIEMMFERITQLGGIQVRMRMQTKDRNFGTNMNIWMIAMLPERTAAVMSNADLHSWLRAALRDMLLHELDEHIRVDGVLIFDPHAHEARR